MDIQSSISGPTKRVRFKSLGSAGLPWSMAMVPVSSRSRDAAAPNMNVPVG